MAAMPDGSPEIFTSIQGEGPMSGWLTVFARLSACNLYCHWCDTPYTWRWTTTRPHDDDVVYDRVRWQVRMSAHELVEDIRGRGPTRVIFTGGEPLLQHRALLPVLVDLRAAGVDVEFETNGTILPPPEFTERCTLIAVSPKLANSGIDLSARIIADALRGLVALPQSIFKFVVTSAAEFDEVAALRNQFAIDARRIWIMPCGRSADETALVGRRIIDRVMASGYNYSARLHLSLFGDTQGT